MYIRRFTFPDEDTCYKFILEMPLTCYEGNTYPFDFMRRFDQVELEFAPVTILYGGNGSGKSTLLNVMAEKLGLQRDSLFNRTDFHRAFVDLCDCDVSWEFDEEIRAESRIITSDDVFDFMLDIRAVNQGIDRKREELFDYYYREKDFRFRSMADLEELKKLNESRRKTKSAFVRGRLKNSIRTRSNGESAFQYFIQKIEKPGLYILDEPENSLSPKLQLELRKYLMDSARYFGCQFIISSHSPFLLSMEGAAIYDIENGAVKVDSWTDLENVRIYRDFFKEHEREFEG